MIEKCERCPLADPNTCPGQSTRRACVPAGTPRSLPPAWQQAINFGVSTVRHVAQGLPQTPAAMLAERLATCDACEHLTADRRCVICGCPVAAKAARAGESCPASPRKWDAVVAGRTSSRVLPTFLAEGGTNAARLPAMRGRPVVLAMPGRDLDAEALGRLPPEVVLAGVGDAAARVHLEVWVGISSPPAVAIRPDWAFAPVGVPIPWPNPIRFQAGKEDGSALTEALRVLAHLGAARVLVLDRIQAGHIDPSVRSLSETSLEDWIAS